MEAVGGRGRLAGGRLLAVGDLDHRGSPDAGRAQLSQGGLRRPRGRPRIPASA